MVLRYTEYYEKFACIADKCEDTCCAGWEIDIDDESYQNYQKVQGEFGKRLRESIREYDADDSDMYERHGFILKEGKRCPFLNEKNLCELYQKLGEESLCFVCTNTPRNFLEIDGVREVLLSPSCGEAGRLLFGSDKKIQFVEKEVSGELDYCAKGEDREAEHLICAARNQVVLILQDRAYPLKQRIGQAICYAKEVQNCLNEENLQSIKSISLEEIKERYKETDTAEAQQYDYFCQRLESFEGMEKINQEWEQFLIDMHCLFDGEKGMTVYTSCQKKLFDYIEKQGREYEYEHMLVYLSYLYLARSVDDFNFWGKMQYVISGYLMMRDMDMVCFLQGKEQFPVADRVRVSRIFAKETEHSQDNLDYLEEEFLFEDIYKQEMLFRQI